MWLCMFDTTKYDKKTKVGFETVHCFWESEIKAISAINCGELTIRLFLVEQSSVAVKLGPGNLI